MLTRRGNAVELHPQFITKEGRDEYVVLPADEFLTLEAMLEDYQAIRDLREAKIEEGSADTVSLDAVLLELDDKDA
jgi:PHD/YefM family antitoxin component YafN of YafNO toxin-antitoxin module